MGREGPILHDGIYWGEDYTEQRERSGWSEVGFTDKTSLWLQVEELPSPLSPNGTLSLQSMPPIRIGAGALHTDLLGMEPVEWRGERSANDPLGAPITAVSIKPVYSSPATGVDVFDLQQVSPHRTHTHGTTDTAQMTHLVPCRAMSLLLTPP